MRLLSLGLAAWRLTRMAVYESGPNDVFVKLRERSGIEYDPDGRAVSYPSWNPLHCMYCTSVYAAVVVVLLPRPLADMLAVSGVVALIEIATEAP